MSDWFESVAEARRRARKRLPASVYGALIAGSERGRTIDDNIGAFAELGFAPHVAGHRPRRELATSVLGQAIALPVIISPTGVQAVHPDGEVAVARAAAARGTAMGLSSFASKPVEEVVAANPQTFFQVYWSGSKDQLVQRLDRARAAGAVGLIATLDWSFSMGRDWGSPVIPERIDLKAALRFAPEALARPRWLREYPRTGHIPDLTVPNMANPGEPAPTFFGAYGEWMQTPAAELGGRGLAAPGVGRPVPAQGRDPDRRRPPRGGRRGERDLRVQPRRQQPGRHPGHDPGPARDRRSGRRPDRDPARRRRSPRQRRDQGASPSAPAPS